MKTSIIVGLVFFVSAISFGSQKDIWKGLKLGHIELKYPLLTIQGSKGVLGCGYISIEACNATKEACAIVTGVKTHEDMLNKKVKFVSKAGRELGIRVGMTGSRVLELIR